MNKIGQTSSSFVVMGFLYVVLMEILSLMMKPIADSFEYGVWYVAIQSMEHALIFLIAAVCVFIVLPYQIHRYVMMLFPKVKHTVLVTLVIYSLISIGILYYVLHDFQMYDLNLRNIVTNFIISYSLVFILTCLWAFVLGIKFLISFKRKKAVNKNEDVNTDPEPISSIE